MGCGFSDTKDPNKPQSTSKKREGEIEPWTELGGDEYKVWEDQEAKEEVKREKELDTLIEVIMQSVQELEPQITQLMKDLANEQQGEVSGLDFRFKRKESLQRKLQMWIDQTTAEMRTSNKRAVTDTDTGSDTPTEGPDGLDPMQLIVKKAWEIPDALRYTLVFPSALYVTAVKASLAGILAHNPEITTIWEGNYWEDGDNYQGINYHYGFPWASSPTGMLQFEVQFHTPESFKVKQESHHLYQEFRTTKNPNKKQEKYLEQAALAKQIPVPEGVLEIPSPWTIPLASEVEMYAELAQARVMKAEGEWMELLSSLLAPFGVSATADIMSIPAIKAQLDEIIPVMVSDRGSQIVLRTDLLRCHLGRLHDVLAFVVVIEEEEYTEKVRGILNAIQATEHFTLVEASNHWVVNDPGYREGLGGIRLNLTGKEVMSDKVSFLEDEKVPFSLVLHTPLSVFAQERMVKVISRTWTHDPNSKGSKKAGTILNCIRNQIKVPDGADTISADVAPSSRNVSIQPASASQLQVPTINQ